MRHALGLQADIVNELSVSATSRLSQDWSELRGDVGLCGETFITSVFDQMRIRRPWPLAAWLRLSQLHLSCRGRGEFDRAPGPVIEFVRPRAVPGQLRIDLLLAERRIAPRRNSSIEAAIVFGTRRVSCVLRNVSEGGAKLEVSSVKGIPDNFDLMVPKHRPQRCRVMWRSLKEVGVFRIARC